MRGAADAFGVVTRFHSQTAPHPNTVINWGYTPVKSAYTDKDTFVDYIMHFQDFALNSTLIDRNISFGIYLDGTVFNIAGVYFPFSNYSEHSKPIGMYFGDFDRFNNTILPAMFDNWQPYKTLQNDTPVDWLTSMALLDGAPSIGQPTTRTGYTQHSDFFAKSLTIPESSGGFTKEAAGAYYDYIIANNNSATPPWFAIINLYGGPDSQINTKDTKFAAYRDRDSLWVIQHYSNTDATHPDVNLSFVNGLNDAITNAMPNVNIGAYLNYIDPTLTRDQAKELYYGDELYGQLQKLKRKWDPKNVFWNPLAVEA